MLVRDVMTSPVFTVGPDTPIKTAVVELTSRGFTAMPVVDDGRLVGVITEADLVRDRVRHGSSSSSPAVEPPAARQPMTVGAVMTCDVQTSTPLTDVADLVAMMIDRRIRSVPVVSGDRLVGIVSRRDVLAVFARADVAIAAAVRGALQTSGGPERWTVEVNRGVVQIGDRLDDATERSSARALASDVPGVLDVEFVVIDR